MERADIVDLLVEKILETDWHWLTYHFKSYKDGYEHFLSAAIVDSCLIIECVIPGYTEKFSTRLAALSGKEKYQPHYEQIIQLLAELYVIRHLASVDLDGAKFIHEPTTKGSNKNPELGIEIDDKQLFFEVKCRDYAKYHNERTDARVQLASRIAGARELAQKIAGEEGAVVLPRDNVVKEYLKSADSKFAGFKQANPDAICVLVIVWDDFIYEPISSLNNDASGLLTEKSFHREYNAPVTFDNIDAILVVRQIHHFVRATRDIHPVDGLKHPLDWGARDEVLPKALIPVSKLSDELQDYLCRLLGAERIDDLQYIAEYRPQDIILNRY